MQTREETNTEASVPNMPLTTVSPSNATTVRSGRLPDGIFDDHTGLSHTPHSHSIVPGGFEVMS